jgi:hypothetical protein
MENVYVHPALLQGRAIRFAAICVNAVTRSSPATWIGAAAGKPWRAVGDAGLETLLQ